MGPDKLVATVTLDNVGNQKYLFLMLNRFILNVTKFQLPPPNRLGTVIKNIFGVIPMSNRVKATEGKNQTLVGAIPFCGEYPGPRFEDKFRSANQIDGISIADGGKMADS